MANEIKEVDINEALELIGSGRSKIVWLGREPVDYIRQLLDLKPEAIEAASPNRIVIGGKEEAGKYTGRIFMCYHGRTSRYVAESIKENYGVDSLNLKGGITAIVGEIF